MEIVSIGHKGLKDYILEGKEKGLRQELIPRIRTIIAALEAAEDMDGVLGPPGWRIHQLKGDRAGDWSISVSGNWRLTFQMIERQIHFLELEDYH
ncbi:type II toxin-antitoxin system RelE/ParE family toxin [Parvularcula sp. IMCC14364]|uniref:type II toxin-antitoxin system RelE/ParE family toxin n=1 Tax=Parvularcula sp. IMCC14364 TaxID=3067902 RepID=UPI002741E58E|nr:type II toxin-antitoxin system RelE/ParE family toxin [Parvularcula sp. IMCC14364]